MLSIHLDQDMDLPNELGYRPTGNRTYLVIFGVIAFFILVIASINFMNLSTARSLSRAKEVSLRKVMGSGRKLLIQQFLVESVFLGAPVARACTYAGEPAAASLQQPGGHGSGDVGCVPLAHDPFLVVLAILVGLLSGAIRAFVLASFNPSPP
ncbi:MAG: FtsX-like permease family protein [Bacteroidales bacterium]